MEYSTSAEYIRASSASGRPGYRADRLCSTRTDSTAKPALLPGSPSSQAARKWRYRKYTSSCSHSVSCPGGTTVFSPVRPSCSTMGVQLSSSRSSSSSTSAHRAGCPGSMAPHSSSSRSMRASTDSPRSCATAKARCRRSSSARAAGSRASSRPSVTRRTGSLRDRISSAALSQHRPRPTSVRPGRSLRNRGWSLQIWHKSASPPARIRSHRPHRLRKGQRSSPSRRKWGGSPAEMLCRRRLPNGPGMAL